MIIARICIRNMWLTRSILKCNQFWISMKSCLFRAATTAFWIILENSKSNWSSSKENQLTKAKTNVKYVISNLRTKTTSNFIWSKIISGVTNCRTNTIGGARYAQLISVTYLSVQNCHSKNWASRFTQSGALGITRATQINGRQIFAARKIWKKISSHLGMKWCSITMCHVYQRLCKNVIVFFLIA